jgi:hypothetical protein
VTDLSASRLHLRERTQRNTKINPPNNFSLQRTQRPQTLITSH